MDLKIINYYFYTVYVLSHVIQLILCNTSESLNGWIPSNYNCYNYNKSLPGSYIATKTYLYVWTHFSVLNKQRYKIYEYYSTGWFKSCITTLKSNINLFNKATRSWFECHLKGKYINFFSQLFYEASIGYSAQIPWVVGFLPHSL